MRRMRRCSPRALAAPVVTAVLALCPLVAGLQSSPAAAADSTTITTNPIQVTLTRLTPIAPQPGDTLVVAGELRNTSSTPITEISYELKMGTAAIGYRSTFDSYAEDQDGDISELGAIPPVVAATRSTLAPGQSEHYQITVPVDQLGLDPNAPQVRELGVSVTSNLTVVGHLRTFLPWDPRDSTSRGVPVGVAWIWPLVDSPHRTTAAGWFNDSLAPELSGTARLGGLLAAGTAAQSQHSKAKHPENPKTSVPVTWAIDPMLVSDVKSMTATYHVTTSTGTTVGKGTPIAKMWLAQLRSALSSAQASVLPLPYGDPDVVAAARAGFSTTIGLASAGGRTKLQQVLGSGLRLLSTMAWPPGGLADQRSINDMLASGDNTLVLSDTALPPVTAPSRTPSAPATLTTTTGGPVDTLLTDSGLNTAVDQGVSNPDGSRVSLQRYLAETLMIHAEAPSDSRNVIVAPNRRWAPSPAYAKALLADTGKVPWIKPVSLSEVQTTTPTDTPIARQRLDYPDSARHNELSGPYLKRVAAVDNQMNDFSSILPPGNPATQAYNTASWEALSSAWRSQHELANTFLTTLGEQVATQIHQVRITSHAGSFVTLTSHGGKVPVTIANDLSVPVTVRVALLANQRLTLSQGGRRTVALPPHQQTVVEVHAAAKTSGVFPVTVQLLTPKGDKKYGDPVKLFVRSTVYGTITLVITGAATAALMIAVAIRLTRRALAARRASAAAT